MPFTWLTVLVKHKKEESLPGEEEVGYYHHVITTTTIVMFLREETGKCNMGELMYWKEPANKREANGAKTNTKCTEDSCWNLL